MEASNRAIARSLINRFERARKIDAANGSSHSRRTVPNGLAARCAYGIATSHNRIASGPEGASPFAFPSFVTEDFANIVRDRGKSLPARGYRDGGSPSRCEWSRASRSARI